MELRLQLRARAYFALAAVALMITTAFGVVLAPPATAAQTIPYKINFQGRLTDNSGNILSDGLYNIKFKLFTVDTGGSNVWAADRVRGASDYRIQITNGLFNIQFGDTAQGDPALSPALFSGTYPLYLEVELPTPATSTCATNGCAVFTEGAMTPRQPLAASPYAFNSDTLDGLDSSAFSQLTSANTFTGANLFAPTAASTVALTVKASTAGGSNSLEVFNSSGTRQAFFDASGALTLSQAITAPTATNTINNLIINSGALSGVTGYAQASGAFLQSGAGTFGTGTGAVSLNGDTTVAAGKNLILPSGAGTIQQTFTSAVTASGQSLAYALTNSGAGVTMQGINLTPTNTTAASSGTNTLNIVNFAAGGALGGTDNTNGLNFASATGYTNFIRTPTAILSSAGVLSGLTGLTLASGNITQTGAGTITTGTGLTTVSGALTVSANRNITITSGTGTFTQTYSAATASTAHAINVANTNTGAGIIMQGVSLTPTNTATASSGTNVLNVLNFAAGGALGGTDATQGINFASATGYTNFINSPTAVLSSSGAFTGLTGVTLASGNIATPGNISTTGSGSITSAGTISVGSFAAATSTTVCSNAGVLASCNALPSSTSLQQAYVNGSTISTAGNDIGFTLNSGQSHTIATAAGGTGGTTFSLTDGANATPPSQLVLVKNNDVDQVLATGISVQSAAGTITTAFDASGSNITNALAIGAHAITGTNFSVTAAGAITAVGINAGSGNIQGTGGLAITGNSTIAGSLGSVTSLSLSGAISGGTTYTGSGNINTTGGAIQTNSTDRITNGGNLVNIGTVGTSGAITAGGAITGTSLATSGNGSINAGTGTITGNGSGLTNLGASNIVQGSGAVTIQSAAGAAATITSNAAATWGTTGANNLTLDSGGGTLIMGTNTATIQKSGTAFSFDLNSGSASTFTVTNGGAGVASLSVEGGLTIGSGTAVTVGAAAGQSSTVSCSANQAVTAAVFTGGVLTTAPSCSTITGTGAATNLNNLTATSINLGLTPSANNSIDLGTAAAIWNDLFVTNIDAGTTTTALTIGANNATTITIGKAAVGVSIPGGITTSNGTINTGSGTITSTGAVTGGSFKVGANDINTGGTLNNVDYLDTASSASATKTFARSGGQGAIFSGTAASGGAQLQFGSVAALTSGSANGTYIGANPAAYSGDFVNFQIGGVVKLKVDNTGNATLGGGLTIGSGTAVTVGAAAGQSSTVSCGASQAVTTATFTGGVLTTAPSCGTIAGTGATTTLNNVGSTSIGAALVASANNTQNIGSAALVWQNVYTGNLDAGTTTTALTVGTAATTTAVTIGRSGVAVSLPGGLTTSNANINAGSGTITGNGSGLTNLNPTNLVQGSGSVTLQSAAATAVTITSNAAATWSTSAGTLTVQGGGGATVRTANSTTTSTSAVLIQSGSATVGANLGAGSVTIDTGSWTGSGNATLALGTTNAKSISLGNTSASTVVAIVGGGGITIGDDSTSKTIGIGNTTSDGADTIEIAIDGTTADSISVGNTNAGTSTVLRAANTIMTLNSSGLSVTPNVAPTIDQVTISNVGKPVTTSGVSGLQINYIGGAIGSGGESSAQRIDVTPGSTNPSTWNGLRIATTAGAGTGVAFNGLKLEGPAVAGGGTETGINITTGWDVGVNVQSGGLQLTNMTDPTTPAAGTLRVYSKTVVGRSMLKALAPSGIDYVYQPSLFQQNVSMITLGTNGATSGINAFGTQVAFTTAPTVAATEANGFLASQATTAVANNTVGFMSNTNQYYRGSVANGSNGFFMMTRVSFPNTAASYTNATSGTRFWAGLTSCATQGCMTANTTPGDAPTGDFAGFRMSGSAGETTFRFLTRNNATTTNQNTAVTLTQNKTYDMYIYVAPLGTTMYWRIDNLTDGTAPVEGSQTLTLPTGATALRFNQSLTTIGANIRSMSWQRVYIESDR